METAELMLVAMVVTTCLVLMTGFPVALSLAGTALLFAGVGTWLGAFDPAFLIAIPQRLFGVMTNEVLIAVPLFILMGTMLERSKVADDLLESMGALLCRLPGGLGISVIVVGTLLAASTGIVGATVVTMGLLALPTMLRAGYHRPLACGIITASGTLGQIIPPSIVLVLLGDVLSASYQKVQLEQGKLSPDPLSVSDLFAGAMLPGLLLAAFYVLYVFAVALLRPEKAPPVEGSVASVGLFRLLKALGAPIALIVAVLGSILAGIATPTEAAAVGAVGTVLLAALRSGTGTRLPVMLAAASLVLVLVLTGLADLRIARTHISVVGWLGIAAALIACVGLLWGLGVGLIRTARAGILQDVVRSTTRMTTMIFTIIVAASIFSTVFRGFDGDELVSTFLSALGGGTTVLLLVVMATMFVLGFFLDVIEITYVVIPVVAPSLLLAGVDPIWLGILMALNLQASYLTPPFGLALFFLRGVAPREVRTGDIYRGIIPFVVIQILALLAIALWPSLATWLPRTLFG